MLVDLGSVEFRFVRRALSIGLLTIVVGPVSVGHAATIEYIAHACFIIESDAGERILIDPFASNVWLGYAFPELPAVDAVVVTHPHYDHDAGRYRGQPWPWDETVQVFDSPGESALGSIKIRGVEGKHADPYGKEFGQLNTVFRIEVDGLSIVHVGDNGPLTAENYDGLRPVDILMVPADSLQHILKNHEISTIVAALEPRVLIPMHYRIPELEAESESPDALGGIESWLEGREHVVRLSSHRWNPAKMSEFVGREPAIVVFLPSPAIARPASGR